MDDDTFIYVDRRGEAWLARRSGANDEDVRTICPLSDVKKEASDVQKG